MIISGVPVGFLGPGTKNFDENAFFKKKPRHEPLEPCERFFPSQARGYHMVR